MISIKTEKEIQIMKEGGKIAAHILNILTVASKPGTTTKELDNIATEEIKKSGAKSSFLGHHGYPATICTSVNNEVVHGIPSNRILREGDLLGLDIGILWKSYHTDTAATVAIGKIDFKKKQLLKITKESLHEGISKIKPGVYLGDIQNCIQSIIEGANYSIIRDLAGHGIGTNLQEPPSILNFGKRKTGPVLKEGMTLAIEPMVSAGDWKVKILNDGWTVVTIDNSLSAHFEHTIAVTKDGVEILTHE